jgi:transcriptional antiterminator Rof (Rho-off)
MADLEPRTERTAPSFHEALKIKLQQGGTKEARARTEELRALQSELILEAVAWTDGERADRTIGTTRV